MDCKIERQRLQHKIALPSSLGIRAIPPEYTSGLFLERSFQTLTYNVNDTPSSLIKTSKAQGCIISNLTRQMQQSTWIVRDIEGTGIILSTTDNPIDVGGFEYAHVHLELKEPSDVWSMSALSYNPNYFGTSWWNTVDITQQVDKSYYLLGPLGISEKLAFLFTCTSAPSGYLSARISVLLKGGGGSTSLALADRTIYLGSDSNVSASSGFPLLPGERQQVVLGENLELWGMSLLPATITLLLT